MASVCFFCWLIISIYSYIKGRSTGRKAATLHLLVSTVFLFYNSFKQFYNYGYYYWYWYSHVNENFFLNRTTVLLSSPPSLAGLCVVHVCSYCIVHVCLVCSSHTQLGSYVCDMFPPVAPVWGQSSQTIFLSLAAAAAFGPFGDAGTAWISRRLEILSN